MEKYGIRAITTRHPFVNEFRRLAGDNASRINFSGGDPEYP
jgi:hypothetical protein